MVSFFLAIFNHLAVEVTCKMLRFSKEMSSVNKNFNLCIQLLNDMLKQYPYIEKDHIYVIKM
jgi:hypothetical protein